MVEKNIAGTITEIEYSPIGKVAVMSGATQKQAYVPLPGGEELSPGPDTYWHTDWLGTVRLASAVSARTITFDRAFAPFGEMYDTVTGGSSNPNYTGDTQDTVSGEFDTPFRELHPTQSRWISPDPAGLGAVDPANPQSWNRYAYVGNSPLTFVDPLGLFRACPKPPPNSVMVVPGGVGYCPFYSFPNGCYFMWGVNEASGGMVCFFGSDNPCQSQACAQNGSGGGTAPPFTDPGPPPLRRNPCGAAGNAPDPSRYAQLGKDVQTLANFSDGFPSDAIESRRAANLLDAGNLASFHRGGWLDAQASGSSAGYANYVFGVYMNAAGYSLSEALSGANAYASLFASYTQHPQMDSTYTSVPSVNVASITNGFNAQQNGTACHK